MPSLGVSFWNFSANTLVAQTNPSLDTPYAQLVHPLSSWVPWLANLRKKKENKLAFCKQGQEQIWKLSCEEINIKKKLSFTSWSDWLTIQNQLKKCTLHLGHSFVYTPLCSYCIKVCTTMQSEAYKWWWNSGLHKLPDSSRVKVLWNYCTI